jgi:HEAT repeat protein
MFEIVDEKPKKSRTTKFVAGRSGNPRGRPKESTDDRRVKLLARMYSQRAIDTLAKLLDSETDSVRVSAACALLDRAYGKPSQSVESTVTVTRRLSYAERFAQASVASAVAETLVEHTVQ